MPASLYATMIETPIGAMVAVAAEQGLVMLEFSEPQRLQRQRASLRRQFGSEPAEGTHPYLSGIADELRAYFAGELQAFATPLHYPGTAFQVRVWDALRTLAYGDTCSYEALATALGDAAATRAVGTRSIMPSTKVTPARSTGTNTSFLPAIFADCIRAIGVSISTSASGKSRVTS